MSGFPKGLLPHPLGSTLVEYALSFASELCVPAVLVGDNSAYKFLNVRSSVDAIPNSGPLSALLGLLRCSSSSHVLALACDMPFVPLELLSTLIEKSSHSLAAVVPVRRARPEPLCAAYCRSLMLPLLEQSLADEQLSLSRALSNIHYLPLQIPVEQEHWFDDWDCPQDCSGSFK
jgi:molybdopterin-guanine dinucleotide biosynthesis protein A